MKREFLQNLKVGEEPLPKEVIDAIMAENGRDITAAKESAVKPYADYESIKEENQRLKDQKAADTVDGKNAQEWKEAYDQAVETHKKEMAGIAFQHVLDTEIAAAKGKNSKAITALLDVDALRESEDHSAAVKAALEELKKESGYLFNDEQVPPPYAPGTGAAGAGGSNTNNESLAGALREKYERK